MQAPAHACASRPSTHSFAILQAGNPIGWSVSSGYSAYPSNGLAPDRWSIWSTDEIKAILVAVDLEGRQTDGATMPLLATMFNTGARVQEVLDLRPDLQLAKDLHARLVRARARKEQIRNTVAAGPPNCFGPTTRFVSWGTSAVSMSRCFSTIGKRAADAVRIR